MVDPGFEIPKDKEKIETYIKHYDEGKPLYEIAQIIWEEKDPGKIKERANRVDIDKIEPFPDILPMPLKALVSKVDKREIARKYLGKKVKELEECA
ncbi:MAG: hypothetical protein JSV92_00470 [archaeon]|nr:MAG: hypothetical protein JSV92_00470 [archaeon]